MSSNTYKNIADKVNAKTDPYNVQNFVTDMTTKIRAEALTNAEKGLYSCVCAFNVRFSDEDDEIDTRLVGKMQFSFQLLIFELKKEGLIVDKNHSSFPAYITVSW